MDGKTAIQVTSEKARAVYENDLGVPLLQELCYLHKVSTREFAEIFGISQDYAWKIIKHQVFPSLPVAIAIARYWEVDVEFLFGWRVDDAGARRPLLIELNGSKELVRLKAGDLGSRTKAIVDSRAAYLRKQREGGYEGV
jgi:transcriptional regulator with XRE-family HTH domain